DSNNGTLQGGASFVPGVTGSAGDQAFNFDGSSGYVNVNDSASLNVSGSQVTVAAWVMKTGSTGNYRTVIDKGYAFNSPYEFRMARDQATNPNDFGIFFGVTTTNGYVIVGYKNPNAELALNTWYNVVGTYDGSSIKIYIDGALIEQAAQSGTLISNSMPVT